MTLIIFIVKPCSIICCTFSAWSCSTHKQAMPANDVTVSAEPVHNDCQCSAWAQNWFIQICVLGNLRNRRAQIEAQTDSLRSNARFSALHLPNKAYTITNTFVESFSRSRSPYPTVVSVWTDQYKPSMKPNCSTVQTYSPTQHIYLVVFSVFSLMLAHKHKDDNVRGRCVNGATCVQHMQRSPILCLLQWTAEAQWIPSPASAMFCQLHHQLLSTKSVRAPNVSRQREVERDSGWTRATKWRTETERQRGHHRQRGRHYL